MSQPDLTVDHSISHTDEELIEWIYEELNTDASYALVNELIERFRPESARKQITNTHWGEEPDDLLDALESLRRRQAARLLRDTFGDEGRSDDGCSPRRP